MSDWTTDYARERWAKLTGYCYTPDPETPSQASESRICFGISWYTDEADAEKVAAYVRSKGFTYNGGWMDGMVCGRDRGFDFDGPDGKRYLAVTH